MAEKEYIERGAAIESIRLTYCKECNSYNGVRCRACEFDDAMSMIEDAPAADVVEVRHGEWIPSPDGINPIKCRNCGTVAPYRLERDFNHDIGLYPYKSNYCPHCGAKMDGGKHETD